MYNNNLFNCIIGSGAEVPDGESADGVESQWYRHRGPVYGLIYGWISNIQKVCHWLTTKRTDQKNRKGQERNTGGMSIVPVKIH